MQLRKELIWAIALKLHREWLPFRGSPRRSTEH